MNKNTTELLNKIYSLYTSWNIDKASDALSELESIDPNNKYVSRYRLLISKKQNQSNVKDSFLRMNWKKIKCKKCGSSIKMTDYNSKSITNSKSNNKTVIILKCDYCWDEDKYSNEKFKSLFIPISIWKQLTIDWEIYIASWAILYEWMWYSNSWVSKWKLKYIEWILISDNWSIIYLSESSADRSEWIESWVENEIEYSIKTFPDFKVLQIDLDWNRILTDVWTLNFSEYNKVTVKQASWDNSKSYSIWENVFLWEIDYKWSCYVFEFETSNTQSEIWFYKVIKPKVQWLYWTWKYNNLNGMNLQEKAWSLLNYFYLFIFSVFNFWLLTNYLYKPPINPVNNVEIWKSYYYDWISSESLDAWNKYTEWLWFSITNQKDVDTFNSLSTTKDITLSKIVSWNLYETWWKDYVQYRKSWLNWIVVLSSIFFIIVSVIFYFVLRKKWNS